MVERDREFVEYVIKEIVNHPEEVQVTRTVDELGVLLSVKVHKDDMGLLIGRSGSTAKAVRTLVRIVGMRNNARVNLRIEEPEGGKMATANENRPRNVDDVMDELNM
ncbi:MAG TPA: KH domain-containing protein [Candidatus Paceibacterota bacterium]